MMMVVVSVTWPRPSQHQDGGGDMEEGGEEGREEEERLPAPHVQQQEEEDDRGQLRGAGEQETEEGEEGGLEGGQGYLRWGLLVSLRSSAPNVMPKYI